MPHLDTALSNRTNFFAQRIPLGVILPWLLFIPLYLLAIYIAGAEEGATSIFKGMYIHDR